MLGSGSPQLLYSVLIAKGSQLSAIPLAPQQKGGRHLIQGRERSGTQTVKHRQPAGATTILFVLPTQHRSCLLRVSTE